MGVGHGPCLRGELRDTGSRGRPDPVEASRSSQPPSWPLGVVMFVECVVPTCWDLAFPEVPGIPAGSPVVWLTVTGSGSNRT